MTSFLERLAMRAPARAGSRHGCWAARCWLGGRGRGFWSGSAPPRRLSVRGRHFDEENVSYRSMSPRQPNAWPGVDSRRCLGDARCSDGVSLAQHGKRQSVGDIT